jgi:hypothetical protein
MKNKNRKFIAVSSKYSLATYPYPWVGEVIERKRGGYVVTPPLPFKTKRMCVPTKHVLEVFAA